MAGCFVLLLFRPLILWLGSDKLDTCMDHDMIQGVLRRPHRSQEKSLRWNRSWSCGDQRLPIDQTFASSTLCAPFGRDECSPDLEGLEGTEGASLGGPVEQTDTPGSADEAQENPTVGATLSLAKHNSGECSPCVFFASMYGCNSMTCEFCHLSHRDAGKRPRPRKQARDTYKEMLRGIFEKKQDRHS